MKRTVYSKLLAWKSNHRRKPLLLQGARQVGKTYLVEAFGKSEYGTFVKFKKPLSAASAEDSISWASTFYRTAAAWQDVALHSFVERLNRLYEQNRPDGHVARYVRRWIGWVHFVFQTVLKHESSQAVAQFRTYLQVAGTTLTFLVSYS